MVLKIIHKKGYLAQFGGRWQGTGSNPGKDNSYTVLREGQGITLIISEDKASVSCLKTSGRALLHVCVL